MLYVRSCGFRLTVLPYSGTRFTACYGKPFSHLIHISRRLQLITDICNLLHISVIYCRYLQLFSIYRQTNTDIRVLFEMSAICYGYLNIFADIFNVGLNSDIWNLITHIFKRRSWCILFKTSVLNFVITNNFNYNSDICKWFTNICN